MLTRHHLHIPILLALAGACGGEEAPASSGGAAAEVALDVLIEDDGGISILAVYPLEEWRPLAQTGSVMLVYELRAGGEVVTTGQVPDPRIINSEHGGEPHLSFGTASLRLPGIAGDLVFLEGASELGRVAFDPTAVAPQWEEEDEEPASGIGRIRSPLIRDGDVRGRPTRIFGNLPRRNAVDLLFLAEGYTEDQFGRFQRDVSGVARDFRSIMSRQRRYGGRFNFWVQNVRSRSSGIDDPRADRRADTAFDVSFGTGDLRRCTWFTTAAGEEAARRLGRRAGADVVVVQANTRGYGGCANNGLFVVTRHGDAPWVVAHELGHALLGLADEYEDGECRHDEAPNVAFSTRRSRIPWGGQIADMTPLPTPQSAANAFIIGAFEGASYCEEGAFRPQLNCLMRELHRGFDRICLGRLDRFMANLRRNGHDGDGDGTCGDGTCAADETDASCAADCGCAASSCEISPFGCFCDPECTTNGDCCADACAACGSC